MSSSEKKAKRRPLGLKRSMQLRNEEQLSEAKNEDMKNKKVVVENEDELKIALPSESKFENDGISLFHAGIGEFAKGNDAIGKKFLEGSIHELESQCQQNEKMNKTLYYYLGMVWSELGQYEEEISYLEKAIGYFNKCKDLENNNEKENTSDDNDDVDNGDVAVALTTTIFSMYYMKHTEKSEADEEGESDNEDDEEDEVIEASSEEIENISVSLKLLERYFSANPEKELSKKHSQFAAKVGDKILNYASTVITNQEKLLKLAKSYFDLSSKVDTSFANVFSVAQCLLELGRTSLRKGSYEDGRNYFESAKTLVESIFKNKIEEMDEKAHGDGLALVGEIYVEYGNYFAYIDKDEDSNNAYTLAYKSLCKARDVCRDSVEMTMITEVQNLIIED